MNKQSKLQQNFSKTGQAVSDYWKLCVSWQMIRIFQPIENQFISQPDTQKLNQWMSKQFSHSTNWCIHRATMPQVYALPISHIPALEVKSFWLVPKENQVPMSSHRRSKNYTKEVLVILFVAEFDRERTINLNINGTISPMTFFKFLLYLLYLNIFAIGQRLKW